MVGFTIRRTTRFCTSRIARAADHGSTVAPRSAPTALTSVRTDSTSPITRGWSDACWNAASTT